MTSLGYLLLFFVVFPILWVTVNFLTWVAINKMLPDPTWPFNWRVLVWSGWYTSWLDQRRST